MTFFFYLWIYFNKIPKTFTFLIFEKFSTNLLPRVLIRLWCVLMTVSLNFNIIINFIHSLYSPNISLPFSLNISLNIDFYIAFYISYIDTPLSTHDHHAHTSSIARRGKFRCDFSFVSLWFCAEIFLYARSHPHLRKMLRSLAVFLVGFVVQFVSFIFPRNFRQIFF